MFPGLDPKKMQAVMKQMGIAQEEIDAHRVVIETSQKNIVINNPSVIKIKMQGQSNFQISGEITEEASSREDAFQKPSSVGDEDTTEEDIQTIMDKTGCDKEKAKNALESSKGDLTEAILSLS